MAAADLSRRAAAATPLELDAIVDELANDAAAPDALAGALADPSTAAGAGRLLVRINAHAQVPAIVPLLDAPEGEVREAAAIALAELEAGERGAVARELAGGIRRLPQPVADEATAVGLVDRAERLARIVPLPDDVARRLGEVLHFLPPGAPRSLVWPLTWIRAARLLGRRSPPDELREVTVAGQPAYLSALGALELARAGIRDEVVDDWLLSTRDYHLLTPQERRDLEPLVAGLSEAAVARLRAIDG
jgi:hypothetical protein